MDKFKSRRRREPYLESLNHANHDGFYLTDLNYEAGLLIEHDTQPGFQDSQPGFQEFQTRIPDQVWHPGN